MRHNRRAVMAERYKLYMKKHIFNDRYLARNMQVVVCFVLLVAVIVCAVTIGKAGSEGDACSEDISSAVVEALFGTSEESHTVVKKETSEEGSEEGSEESSEAVAENITSTESDTEVAITEAVYAAVVVDESIDGLEEIEQEEEGEFAHKCIANVDEKLNVRKEANAESEFVGSMNPGAIAIVEGVEGEWTKIKSGEVEGYVLSQYVLTGACAERFAEDYVTLRGTVLEDGVNIRKEQSTEADIVIVLGKDDTVTVLKEESETEVEAVAAGTLEMETEQETTEVIDWIPVQLEDGQTGYVSADLIEVEELYEIAVSAEELERLAQEEAARLAAEEEAARQAAEAAYAAAQNSAAYQGASTTPVTSTASGECIGTFTVTAYCGCSKCSGGNSRTASGTIPTEGRTIAADTSILPFGTQVVIDGIVYTVEDCGSGVNGNHIDIFFATHEDAMAYGTKKVKVYKY